MEEDRPGPPAVSAPRPTLEIGPWRVDPRADEIAAEGRTLRLEPLKMRLLMALAARPGDVVLTRELLDEVWPGVVVGQNSVYQGIAQLRKTLGDDPAKPLFIETVPRKGYRLVAPVRWEPGQRPGAESAGRNARAAPTPGAALAIDIPAATVDTAAEPHEALSPAARGRRNWLGDAVAAAAILVAAGLWGRSGRVPGRSPRLAVLPFTDASLGQTKPSLSSNLSLEVIGELQVYRGLQVIAFESVRALGTNDLGEVARRLDVTHAVRGRIERSNEWVRIDTELLAVPQGTVSRTAVYETMTDRVSVLPREIAAELADALGVQAALRPAAAATG